MIFVLSVIPLSYGGSARGFSHLDKIFHAASYAVLAFLYCRAYQKSYAARAVWIVLYSFLMEVIQYFLPYRSFDLLDLLANSVGTGLGLGGFFALKKARS